MATPCEAIQVLSGKGPADTRELSLTLAAEMLLIGGVVEDYDAAYALAERRLDGGDALEKFASVVRMQGGDPAVCYEPERVLCAASRKKTVTAPVQGVVCSLDARAVGNAIKALGGGRTRKDDVIDPAVGVRILKKIGDSVAEGEAVAEILYNDDAQLVAAEPYFQEAYRFADVAEPRRLILDRVR